MVEARDETIAKLRARLAEFNMERQDESDANAQAEEGEGDKQLISPFGLPPPAFPSDFSSALAAIRHHPTGGFGFSTNAVSTATALRTTKRPRRTFGKSHIEAPHDAGRIGRPCRHSKRAGLRDAGQFAHDGGLSTASSLSSISSLTSLASSPSSWPAGEMSPWDERGQEEQEREEMWRALQSLLLSK
jgi:hypothetical protein